MHIVNTGVRLAVPYTEMVGLFPGRDKPTVEVRHAFTCVYNSNWLEPVFHAINGAVAFWNDQEYWDI